MRTDELRKLSRLASTQDCTRAGAGRLLEQVTKREGTTRDRSALSCGGQFSLLLRSHAPDSSGMLKSMTCDYDVLLSFVIYSNHVYDWNVG